MDRIKELEQLLKQHSAMYYAGNEENCIPDQEFDALEQELRQLDPANAYFSTVGSNISSATFSKITHPTLMLSLQKCYVNDEYQGWVRAMQLEQDKVLAAMCKLDGFAVELVFTQDDTPIDNILVLTQAVSRGNGRVGEDITTNIKQVRGIPQSITAPDGMTEMRVRGEVVMLKDVFAKSGLIEQGYKSARNTAAGTIRNKDPQVVKDRCLDFFAYNIVGHREYFESLSMKLTTLASCNFQVVQYKTIYVQGAEDTWQSLNSNRDSLPYDADGIVLAIDDSDAFDNAGATDHHPKGAIAWKFEFEQVKTTIKDILWQVSRTGLINPVALFEPIELEGATIERATLHNISEITRLGIRQGSTLTVIRQGGVIPKILAAEGGSEPFNMPTHCPACNEPTATQQSEEGIVTLHCLNPECPAVTLHRVLHYIKAMGIDDLGEGTLIKLMDAGIIAYIQDLYRIQAADIMKLDKLGKKSADKIVYNIWNTARNAFYGKFLWGLGIPGVGKVMAETIAKAFPEPQQLMAITPEMFMELEGIQETSATRINDFLRSDFVYNILHDLAIDKHRDDPTGKVPILNFKKPILNKTKGPLTGSTFLVTGTLSVGRKELMEMVEAHGGMNLTAVSAKLNYLIAGEKAGSKLDRAQKNGVTKVLTEDEFYALIKESQVTAEIETEVNEGLRESTSEYDNFAANIKGGTKLVEYVLEKYPSARDSDDGDGGLYSMCMKVIKDNNLNMRPSTSTLERVRRTIQYGSIAKDVLPRFLPTSPYILFKRLRATKYWRKWLGYETGNPHYSASQMGYADEKYNWLCSVVKRHKIIEDIKATRKKNRANKKEAPIEMEVISKVVELQEAPFLPEEDYAISKDFKATGLGCEFCGKPQYATPSGDVCVNGHGGAAGVEPPKAAPIAKLYTDNYTEKDDPYSLW